MMRGATRTQTAPAFKTGTQGKGQRANRRLEKNFAKSGAMAPPVHLPSEFEIVAAVESLCKDQLRPYGRLIRKRLAELAVETASVGTVAPDADLFTLRRLCESSPHLVMEHAGEADWSVVVRGTCPSFIDIYSVEDCYGEGMWCAFAAYLDKFKKGSTLPAGGRYACAQGLMALKLPFLQGMSLGQVSHIVQIAMTSRKLLGYYNGGIVPYARSETAMKEQCAEYQMLTKRTKLPLATWDVLRAFLSEVLLQVGEEGFPLSNVKRVLRTRFKVDLSETALGYVAVSELFRDARFHHLCSVRLLENGYYLFRKFQDVLAQPVSQVVFYPVPVTVPAPSTPMTAPRIPSLCSTTPFMKRGTNALVNRPDYLGSVDASQSVQHTTDLVWGWVDSNAAGASKKGTDQNEAINSFEKRDVLDEGRQPACDADSVLESTLSKTLGETLDSTLNSALSSTLDSAAFGEALDLTLDEPLDVKLCTLGSTDDEHSTNSSPDITAPPTPRRLCGSTPSPDYWRDSIFEHQLSMAVEKVSQSRMQVSGDCSEELESSDCINGDCLSQLKGKAACEAESFFGSTLSTTLGETLGSTLNSALGSTLDSAALSEALDLTFVESLDVKFCETLSSTADSTLGSTRDDHSTSCSPDITAPSTPRRLCDCTPSPNNSWRDGIFEQQLSMAVNIVTQSRIQISGDCGEESTNSDCINEVGNQDRNVLCWRSAHAGMKSSNVTSVNVKNTFLNIECLALDDAGDDTRSKSWPSTPSAKNTLNPSGDCFAQLKDFAHHLRSRVDCISRSVRTSSHDAPADHVFHNDLQTSFDWSSANGQPELVAVQHLPKISTGASEKEVKHLCPLGASARRSNDANIYFQKTKHKMRFGCLDSDSD